MKASFVIVNYNRRDELLETLRKTIGLIAASPHLFEIIVVDNASIDGSADAVETSFPEVILIRNAVNTGAPAWNIGFELAQGEYFIIIDDDSHIESGLNEALAYMDSHLDVGVLALNVVTGPYTPDMWDWRDGEDIAGFIGCGAILRRTTFQRIGGYAEWMFLYVNEWEYTLRCIDAGYKVRFFSNSKVIHRASKINRSNKRLRVLVTMHELAIVYKYFAYRPKKYLIRVMLNSMKCLKDPHWSEFKYNLMGIRKFFQTKAALQKTPVSREAQDFFAERFISTGTPVLGFVGRKLRKIKIKR